jgi:sulfide:quinone oxidoreductase
MPDHPRVLILGGGTAGITVAAQLRRAAAHLDIGIVEPSECHFYQPLWTLVGAGVFPPEASRRREADFIPNGTDWIRGPSLLMGPSLGLGGIRSVTPLRA